MVLNKYPLKEVYRVAWGIYLSKKHCLKNFAIKNIKFITIIKILCPSISYGNVSLFVISPIWIILQEDLKKKLFNLLQKGDQNNLKSCLNL